MLEVFKFIVGEIQTNCYVILDKKTNESALIDPGDISLELDKFVSSLKNLKYILLTHGHFDHIAKAKYFKDKTGAKIAISKDDSSFITNPALNLQGDFKTHVEEFTPDIILDENSNLFIGDYKINILKTPGHTRGSLCFLIDNNMFSGDTLMKECMGRTDFPTGGVKAMFRSLKRLYNLDKNYKVHPGHAQTTTLNYEKQNNKYLLYANKNF